MSEKELLPCPFCGMKVMAFREHPKLGVSIECGRLECNVMTRYFPTKERAIKAWNTRKSMEEVVEKLEEATWMTDPTYDDDGYSNDDGILVITASRALRIVKETAC